MITVITPTYNRADYLVETIESVLSQGYPNLEYIVLDDGSQDNTKDILSLYAGRLTWESHPNMGETRTVNKGFSMAHGEIIGVVNSDDPLLPGALKEVAQYMQDHPEIGVVYPDWDMVDAEGHVIEHRETLDYSYLDMLRMHHCTPGPGAFFRAQVIRSLEGRDPQFRYVADYDFWLRAGLITQFARIPKPLATFRVHSGSASSNQTNELMAVEHIKLINKIYNLQDLNNEILSVRKEAFSSAYFIAGVVAYLGKLPSIRKYLWQAFWMAPLKYFGEYRDRLMDVILPSLIRPFHYAIKGPYLLVTDPKRLFSSISTKLKLR